MPTTDVAGASGAATPKLSQHSGPSKTPDSKHALSPTPVSLMQAFTDRREFIAGEEGHCILQSFYGCTHPKNGEDQTQQWRPTAGIILGKLSFQSDRRAACDALALLVQMGIVKIATPGCCKTQTYVLNVPWTILDEYMWKVDVYLKPMSGKQRTDISF